MFSVSLGIQGFLQQREPLSYLEAEMTGKLYIVLIDVLFFIGSSSESI